MVTAIDRWPINSITAASAPRTSNLPLCDHRCDGLFPHRRARHQRLPAQGLGADADSRLLPRTIRVCLPRLYRGEDLGKDEGTRLTWRAYGDVYLGQHYAVSEDSSVDCLWEGCYHQLWDTSRLLITNGRSVAVWSILKALSSYFPSSPFRRLNPESSPE